MLAGLTALAAAVAVWHVESAPAVDRRPVVLPAVFLGLSVRPGNFSTEASWTSTSEQALKGAGSAATEYGTLAAGQPRTPLINVIAARTDLTGKLDQRLAGDQGDLLGGTRCTQTLRLQPDTAKDAPPVVMPTMMLCWRLSGTFSITALAVLRPPAAAELAAAVDTLWDQLTTAPAGR